MTSIALSQDFDAFSHLLDAGSTNEHHLHRIVTEFGLALEDG